jgi:hypothetical protein
MALNPRLLTASREVVQRSAVLDADCTNLLATVRARCPAAGALLPLPPSQVGAAVPLTPDEAQRVYSLAFADAAAPGGVATGAGTVVWASGEDELLVQVNAVRLVLTEGFTMVEIPVFTEQSNDVNVVVPFAVGTDSSPLGLIMATETVPRGPAVIVQRWGEHLTAAAWQALVHVASGIAAASGTDQENQPLLPASLSASAGGLTVLPQATHAFDRLPTS